MLKKVGQAQLADKPMLYAEKQKYSFTLLPLKQLDTYPHFYLKMPPFLELKLPIAVKKARNFFLCILFPISVYVNLDTILGYLISCRISMLFLTLNLSFHIYT